MSLRPQKLPEVPEETARIAKILFPKGNKYMWLRDELDVISKDEQFTSLYHKNEQLAEQPGKLAVMSIIQYMENYTDRQAAEALKDRIDLKYALSLELTDPGVGFFSFERVSQSFDRGRIGRSYTHNIAQYL